MLTVPAFSLNGFEVSSGMNFSRSSRRKEWSMEAFPVESTVKRLKGIDLFKIVRIYELGVHESVISPPPDGFVVLRIGGASLEEAVLADTDASLDLGDLDNREAHLLRASAKSGGAE